jgi:predicted nucleic acid-binding protein
MQNARDIVLDASAAIAFVAKEKNGSRIGRLLASFGTADRSIIVPQFFWLEVINGLAGRRKWAGVEVLEAIADLDAFEIETVEQDRSLVVLTIDLVERHGLIAYDAAYLALAIQQDAELLTLDRRLAAAAGPRSVPIDGEHLLAETTAAYDRDVTWPDYGGASAFLAKLRADDVRTR